MNLLLGIEQGFKEIWAHKFRSFLTMLGVILGVASLMAMFALTAGIAAGVGEYLMQIGGIERIDITDGPPPVWQEDIAELSPGRTYADVVALRHSANLLAYVSPNMALPAKLARLNHAVNPYPYLYGVEGEFLEVEKHKVASGRFLSDLDEQEGNHVVVIGASLVDALWPDEADPKPVGETIRINGEDFKVVGVFQRYSRDYDQKVRKSMDGAKALERRKARGNRKKVAEWQWDAFYAKNHTAVIPLKTMRQVFKSAKWNNATAQDDGPDIKLNELTVRVKDFKQFDATVEQIKNVLTSTHNGIQDFSLDTREEWFERVQQSINSTRLSGGLIAGISLLVGGLGIANIMLASITERIREIGIRRAVGARGIDIFLQILIEGTVLSTLGGVIGLAAGVGLVHLIETISPSDNAPVIELSSVFISLGFAMSVGALAGFFPALKAARLSPLQALRYE